MGRTGPRPRRTEYRRLFDRLCGLGSALTELREAKRAGTAEYAEVLGFYAAVVAQIRRLQDGPGRATSGGPAGPTRS